jgi:hypothetical protein
MNSENKTIPQWVMDGAWDTFNKETRYADRHRFTAFVLGIILSISLSLLTFDWLLSLRDHIGKMPTFLIGCCLLICPLVLSLLFQIAFLEKRKKRKIENDKEWQKAFLQSIRDGFEDYCAETILFQNEISKKIAEKTQQAIEADQLLSQY